MIEHEPHLVAMTIEPRNAVTKGSDQIVQRSEQHVGQDRSFQVTPQSLDQIQARTIRRQPENRDLIAVRPQPFLDGLCVMEPTVVTDHTDLAASVDRDQYYQKRQEVRAALAGSDGVGDPAGRVVYASVDDLLLVFPGSGNLGLGADQSPHPGQGRMPMDLHLILEDQDLGRVRLCRPFFKRTSCRPALRYAGSSRLPFVVCLGR